MAQDPAHIRGVAQVSAKALSVLPGLCISPALPPGFLSWSSAHLKVFSCPDLHAYSPLSAIGLLVKFIPSFVSTLMVFFIAFGQAENDCLLCLNTFCVSVLLFHLTIII